MIQSELHLIFPTSLYKSKLTRKFTESELHFVEEMKPKSPLTQSHTDVVGRTSVQSNSSDNKYVLNNPPFSTLKKEIDLFIEDYFARILFPPKSISPYITQSWLNYIEPQGYHHPHDHSNSYLSGVVYINAESPHDKIKFEKNRYDQIKFTPTEWNLYNAESWNFPIETGEIILFPSHLKHSVDPTQGKNIRTSLSFNVFLKGDLGNASDSTELKL